MNTKKFLFFTDLKFSKETKETTASIPPLTPKITHEIGETSIDAPAFSPLTPLLFQITEKNILPLPHTTTHELGETSIEAPAFSPLTPLIFHMSKKNISPLPHETTLELGETSIEAQACSLLMTENNISPLSPASSPLPQMSPETRKVFNILSNEQLDSDDSVQDPNYLEQNHNDSSTSDEDYNDLSRET